METKDIIRRSIKLIAIFICIILVVGITEDVLDKEIQELDMMGYEIVSKYLISEQITPVVKVVTELGGAIFLIILAVLLTIIIKNKNIKILMWTNLGISTLLNQVLKHLIQRPRPSEFRIVNASGYSFPSGHSMVSVAFYGFLIYLINRKVKNKYLKWGSTIILSLLMLAIGISRIYLGVHYTSDVLAGILISVSYLIIFISISKNILKGIEND